MKFRYEQVRHYKQRYYVYIPNRHRPIGRVWKIDGIWTGTADGQKLILDSKTRKEAAKHLLDLQAGE